MRISRVTYLLKCQHQEYCNKVFTFSTERTLVPVMSVVVLPRSVVGGDRGGRAEQTWKGREER